ncbi:BgTH12-07806 [Blumeria graminis f. sp. triticale]|uniref:BgtE-20029 n=3 Tax=Blumeria graminis TaxID=34373 RepID=A0A381LDE1_BLUGR|nr:BgTH12-07806 [Blumeria graminis f. sp. triticale]VDB96438.1 BgtE-20029 [Blumeria graminis f. sp. tritici]
MKFPSAIVPAAWAGLLLLVPAVYAEPHFNCSGVIPFTLARLENFKRHDGFSEAKPGDPRGPNGEEYLSYQFGATPPGRYSTSYLAQIIDEYPFFRAFERDEQVWEPCIFLKTL